MPFSSQALRKRRGFGPICSLWCECLLRETGKTRVCGFSLVRVFAKRNGKNESMRVRVRTLEFDQDRKTSVRELPTADFNQKNPQLKKGDIDQIGRKTGCGSGKLKSNE